MRRFASLLLLASLACGSVAWQRVNQLQHNGKTVSTNLRVVDGDLMVSARDVAAYLGGELTVANGTATVVSDGKAGSPAIPGGTYSGVIGPTFAETKRPESKVFVIRPGEEATNDGFTLQVVSVEEAAKDVYRTVYDGRAHRFTPRQKEDRLLVAKMRIVNRKGETARPPLPSAFDTALFDSTGVGVPVLAFDARSSQVLNQDGDAERYRPLEAPLLTADGAFEFAALFSLPKGNALKRLTVELPSATEYGGGTKVMVDLEK